MRSDLALYIVWCIFRSLFIIGNSDIIRNIHVHSDIFSHIVAFLEAYVTLAYSEHCHIQNPGIFRTQDIFRTMSRHLLVYSERCVTLAYWEPCPIQNSAIFRILAYLGPEAYSESCLFRHIQAYSDIFNNHSYNNINFLFTLTLHPCRKTYMLFDYNDVISMLDWVYLNNTHDLWK